MERLPYYLLTVVVAGSALFVACAPKPDDAPDFEVSPDNNLTESADAAPADDEGESTPAVVESVVPADPSEIAEEEPGDAGSSADAGTDARTDARADAGHDAGVLMTMTKSATCTSKYGSHSSYSKLTWTVTGTKVTIKSLLVQVNNAYKRNLNDVDVYGRPYLGTEAFLFNSGDILTSGKLVTVPYRANTIVKPGYRVRILTNFDESGSDPYASCAITMN